MDTLDALGDAMTTILTTTLTAILTTIWKTLITLLAVINKSKTISDMFEKVSKHY